MRTLKAIFDSRRRDEAGATFIFAAAAMLLLLVPVCAYMLTIGATTENNVALQSLADAGAYDAAQVINSSTSVSSAITNALAENAGDITGASLTPTQGCYLSGTFTAGTCASGDYNAVKVVATKGHPKFILGGPSLSRSAIVSQEPTADLSVGSYLATVSTDQATVLNDLFDHVPGYSGSNLSVSALSYQSGLLGTNITLQQLINSSSSVLSTSNVVSSSTSVTYANLAKWVYEAATGNTSLSCSSPSTPLAIVACTLQNDTSTTSICAVVAMLGCSNNSGTVTAGALIPGELSQNISVFTFLDDAALQSEFASGSSALDITGGLGSGGLLSGLSSAKLAISAIQPPQEADGAPGPTTKATTSQASVTLTLSLLGLGLGLTTGTVTFTAANGSATLASLDCSNGTVDSATVTASTSAASASFTGGLAGLTLNVEALPSTKTLTFINTPDALLPPPGSGTGNNANPQTFSFGSGGSGDLINVTGSITGLLGGLLGTLTGILTGLSNDLTGLGPVFQALGLSIAGENVTLQSVNCSPLELVK